MFALYYRFYSDIRSSFRINNESFYKKFAFLNAMKQRNLHNFQSYLCGISQYVVFKRRKDYISVFQHEMYWYILQCAVCIGFYSSVVPYTACTFSKQSQSMLKDEVQMGWPRVQFTFPCKWSWENDTMSHPATTNIQQNVIVNIISSAKAIQGKLTTTQRL